MGHRELCEPKLQIFILPRVGLSVKLNAVFQAKILIASILPCGVSVMVHRSHLSAVVFSLSVLIFTGCTANHVSPPVTVHAVLHGIAMGGEQPITASRIRLYQVGTTGDGSTATDLLGTNVVTTSDGTSEMNANANAGNDNNQLNPGSFTLTGDYTCPTSDTLVYLAAVGGNPGAGTNNVQEQIVALGDCGSLSASTFIIVNEITTVGTTAALHNYMTGYNAIGSSNADAAAMATAFNTATEYMNSIYGTAPGPNLPAGYDASSNDLRALANVVQNCVNSNGSTANGTNCGLFFTAAQGTAASVPGDTVTALLDVFADPTHDVHTLFDLQGTVPAFEPTFTSPPTDWSLPIRALPPAPTFSPGAGAVASGTTVTISDTDGTATIYYTTDGSMPSTSSSVYSSAVTVTTAETINAIAVDANGRLTSPEGSAGYTVSLSTPMVGLSAVSAPNASTTAVTITASGNDNGSVVTFGVTSPADGRFSPATCTISGGTCSVSYVPSGVLAAGTYTNDLTASFAATGSYTASSASNTLTIAVAPTYGFSTVYSFGTQSSDGYGADGTLIQASDGNFYGTTNGGGSSAYGTIFKVAPGGTYTTLYAFTNGSDGGYPYAGLIQGRDGNLYGTTTEGGASQSQGTIFEYVLSGPSAGLTTLYAFTGGADGGEPTGGVIQGADGNFYGAGEDGGGPNQGTIFEYVPGTGITTLYTFTSSVGGLPAGRLLQGADGNFYGTTLSGGSSGEGIVFELAPNGTNSTLTTLYSFTGGNDGGSPDSGLTQGADGNFYGTASFGGTSYGGVIFELVPNGTNSTFTTLYNFTNGSDGTTPEGNLLLGSDGNFYGTSYGQEGFPPFEPSTYGAVFELVPAGTNSQFTVLYPFTGGSDGGNASGGLAQGLDGNLYGTATAGGANSEGVIYTVTASPGLAAPVTLTVPPTVAAGSSFTLSYAASNAYSKTLQTCVAMNSGGDTTGWTGVKTAAPTATNVSLTAPATVGSYVYTLTCGGMETGLATVTVQ
jgi:uncharacterized repeat protein (TIGR03803 family)